MKEWIDSVSWQTSKCRNPWSALHWSHEPAILMSSKESILSFGVPGLTNRSSGPGPILIFAFQLFLLHCYLSSWVLGFLPLHSESVLSAWFPLWMRMPGRDTFQTVWSLFSNSDYNDDNNDNGKLLVCDRERQRREPRCHSHYGISHKQMHSLHWLLLSSMAIVCFSYNCTQFLEIE